MKTLLFSIFFPFLLFAQEIKYSALNIPANLKENANAVIRFNQIDIAIITQRRMNIKQKRVVTVLNEYGLSSIDALEYFDKNRRIIKTEARSY